MIFEFLDTSMTPQTNYFYFWRHEIFQNSSRNMPMHLQQNILGIMFWTIRNLENVGKDGPEQSRRSILFFGNLKMGSKYSRKDGMEFWYYGINIFQQNI